MPLGLSFNLIACFGAEATIMQRAGNRARGKKIGELGALWAEDI